MTNIKESTSPCFACPSQRPCGLSAAPLCQAPARGLGALSLPTIDFSSPLTWAIVAGAAVILYMLMRHGKQSRAQRRRRLQLARLDYEKTRLEQ